MLIPSGVTLTNIVYTVNAIKQEKQLFYIQLEEEEQAAALSEATEEATLYTALDFTIAATIMQRLTETTTIESDVLVGNKHVTI